MFDPKTRILIVDDLGAMRIVLSKMVKEMGFFDLSEATDGDEAWQCILNANPPFDLVISDWNMPNCSGLDLVVRLRADSRFEKIPFLMVTAESDGTQVSLALSAGVDGYVVKPFDRMVLGEKMKSIHQKRVFKTS